MNILKNNNNDKDENSWNNYLAGLIDGDGCLLISKQGFASLEITMDISDEYTLNKIKDKLGGSVKLRSGARAFRYRLHNKAGIRDLINRINGYVRNSKRVPQLQKICELSNIPYKQADKLTLEDIWFAGFFDADGTLGFSLKKGVPQLIISASNKNKIDLEPFREIFGGVIRLDKASNTWKWEIYRKETILIFCNV
jgi:ubiquinol-cytochrome c reductase cytochrome b subunit